MKETRRSLYDSELGVKKMAVGHHLGERSHTIERSHNLLSGERLEKQDFVNLEEGRSEWVWDQGGVEIWVWDWRGEWVCDQGSLVPSPTSGRHFIRHGRWVWGLCAVFLAESGDPRPPIRLQIRE